MGPVDLGPPFGLHRLRMGVAAHRGHVGPKVAVLVDEARGWSPICSASQRSGSPCEPRWRPARSCNIISDAAYAAISLRTIGAAQGSPNEARSDATSPCLI